MKKRYFFGLIVLVAIISLLSSSFIQLAVSRAEDSPSVASVESAATPEQERSQPLTRSAYIQSEPQAAASSNLIPNGSLESGGTDAPTGWQKNRWLSNNAVFTYPVTGVNGGKAARVTITNYTSGDAKWYFNDVPVSAGKTYEFSNYYQSDISSELTLRFKMTNGSYTYKYLSAVNPSHSFTQIRKQFTIPSGVVAVSVFHLIEGAGTLTIDNASLTQTSVVTPPPSTGSLPEGMISFTFDDGSISQYQYALPKLGSAGMKGTFYIVSRRLKDHNYSGYMSKDQVRYVYRKGHEIGAHTRTHAHLTALSPAQARAEIQGSRQDLIEMNVGPVNSFAYPFGEYNTSIIQMVKDAGFTSARSTITRYADKNSVIHELPRHSVEVNTSIEQMKQWVDTAAANKEWLILAIHLINNSGERYSVRPEVFNQLVDYIKEKNIKVVTMSEGAQLLSR
jgi:peptidoglycan/xylan/chitin deacetylase (PgdA/CDA1 family)